MKLVRHEGKSEGKSLHPNNVHNHGYDFDALMETYPALKPHVKPNKHGNNSIDFSNANRLKR